MQLHHALQPVTSLKMQGAHLKQRNDAFTMTNASPALTPQPSQSAKPAPASNWPQTIHLLHGYLVSSFYLLLLPTLYRSLQAWHLFRNWHKLQTLPPTSHVPQTPPAL